MDPSIQPNRGALIPWRPLLLGLGPALLIGGLAVLPTLQLMWFGATATATTGEAVGGFWLGWWQVWADDYLSARITWSLVQASITTGLAAMLGIPVAWVIARWEFVGRGLLLQTLMLPFVVPTLVAAMGVLAWWGPQGLLGQWLAWDATESPWLLIAGNLFFNLCLVIRAGVAGFASQSAAQFDVARTLGATPWRVFWRLELPHAAPAIWGALSLVFLYCLGGFGLALLLGGQQYATAEVVIYTLVAHELELVLASQLALWMLLFTGLVVGLYAWLQMRAATPRTADILHRKTLIARQWMPVLGVAWVWLVCISIGLAPLAAIFVKAMIASAATWQQVATAETADALFNTLRFSGAALGVAVVLGVCHALVGRRFWWWRVWGLLPLMISPVMIAFGLLLLVPQWLDAWPLLVAAYALLALPLVIQPVAQALDALPNAWADAARSLGATPWRVWWRVTLPLVRPAVRRGAAFALATMLGEFAVTLFLSRPEWTTLTTLIYQHLGRAGRTQLESAWVLSAGLLALTLFLFWLLEEPDRKDTHA